MDSRELRVATSDVRPGDYVEDYNVVISYIERVDYALFRAFGFKPVGYAYGGSTAVPATVLLEDGEYVTVYRFEQKEGK